MTATVYGPHRPVILERRLSHKQAQKALSRWIKVQKQWDRILFRKAGIVVQPPPHEVYSVTRDGRKYAVLFDDPTL